MRLLVSILAAFLLVAAGNAPHDYRSFARDAGLPDSVEIHVEDAKSPNGFYWPGGMMCVWFMCEEMPEQVVVFAPKGWPREYVLAVLFHEIGHYHQAHEGHVYLDDPLTEEWDADVRSVESLCRLGLNGPAITAAMLTEFWREPGVVLDSKTHGNLFGRIEHARGWTCHGGPRHDSVQALLVPAESAMHAVKRG